MLRIGLFEGFKPEGGLTILLSGDNKDIKNLADLLSPVITGKTESIPLHNQILVSPNHPVKLFAVRSLPSIPKAGEFFLLCSGELGLGIQDKLKPLMNADDGHQYFDLSYNAGTLMITVGEYNADWWNTHG